MNDDPILDTYQYFTDPAKLPKESDKGQPWYEAHMAKHHELKKLERLDDGEYVFRAWSSQFKGRTMDAIAEELRNPGDIVPLVSDWTATMSHQTWMKEHGESREADGPFVGVMNYGATGEGERVHVIAAHAYSLAHFILDVGKKLQGYYFVIGTTFYRNLDEAKEDRLFKRVVPDEMHGWFSPRCHVDINLLYYINCS